jgi:hypothetical protein
MHFSDTNNQMKIYQQIPNTKLEHICGGTDEINYTHLIMQDLKVVK